MNRKQWIRDTLMAFAVTLVPKILQPCVPEIKSDDEYYYFDGIIPWIQKGGNYTYFPDAYPTFDLSKDFGSVIAAQDRLKAL
jgi:hypothetical protein